MPSKRKRIGFLPSIEVQNIIDKISLEENISQSKVTGILVEEALSKRKANNEEDKSFSKFKKIKDKIGFINEYELLNSELEYELIRFYLDFRRFKKLFQVAKKEFGD